eukprot:365488-Chlamydomonas_euryale.AAC.7
MGRNRCMHRGDLDAQLCTMKGLWGKVLGSPPPYCAPHEACKRGQWCTTMRQKACGVRWGGWTG